MKDLFNQIHPLRVISPVSVADTTAQVGQIIDKRGFESLTYVIATGSIADADATFTVLLEEGDAANLNQWLWAVSGERHHPRPLARRHNHCGVHMLNHA